MEVKFISTLRKISGNSFGITIPIEIVEKYKLKSDSNVEFIMILE